MSELGSLQREIFVAIDQQFDRSFPELAKVDSALLSITAAAVVKDRYLVSPEFRARLAAALIARSEARFAQGYEREVLNDLLADREAGPILEEIAARASE